ncbi:SMC-Scp complex subunit ScpB [Psychrobium sp. MM17-31]|uniref:SMC-Scp complex subunit ScpB n=1 Tax=Psychrobium sp. MM17-31 TaxID=2917758 RepID=UPI001EF56696|nr:SMC-Scp complex subunit ScpB [Psychrobium sp. MM17-31]MCG7531484.1 SMC-Scp complex subunit ScpB [Psychrobium sp. MM17-31]
MVNEAQSDLNEVSTEPEMVVPKSPKGTKQLIEAALFAFDKPMTVKMLKDSVLSHLKLSSKEIKALLDELTSDYQERGIVLRETAKGFTFITDESLSEPLSRLWQEKSPRYSRALLETLALIAYKQPITRGEIEHLRGVAVSSNIMKTLMEREWVKVVGQKDIAGKPSIYGTTKEFLHYFGLTSLAQLPELTESKLEMALSELEQQ